MGNTLGVTRDFQQLENRRIMAIGLWEQGETQATVARRVGVAPQTMSRWVAQYRRNGGVGLKKAGRAGRKPELDQLDRERLHLLLQKGPNRVGRETPQWTCQLVTQLIVREFGVRYHPGHVWKILAALGWSPQRVPGPGDDRKEDQLLRWTSNV
jgi:transposase